MKYFLKREVAYNYDKYCINEMQVPSQILMENAAHSTFNEIMQLKEIESVKNILILCGSGNNGGDGFALARYLSNKFNIEIYFNSDIEEMSNETLTNYKICKNLDISIHNEIKKQNYDLIIEAMTGIGVVENIHSKLSTILKNVNNLKGLKIALDTPAGLNADTGIANIDAFRADYTFTMFAPKPGLFINDGQEVSGKVISISLGIPDKYLNDFTSIKAFEKQDWELLIKPRKQNTSKFDYGIISIIAGSKNMLGAGVLSANSAITAGAGLVHLITTERHSSLLPEVICHCFEQNKYGSLPLKYLNEILEAIDKSDTIAIGPGISNDPEILHLVHKIIENNQEKRIILDADALKCIDSDSQLSQNFIITPHIGEFAKITNLERTFIENNRLDLVEEWSKKLNCTILLKGNPSLISNNRKINLNLTGNSGLATAGSGDVLTGILSATYSRYKDPLFSATLAAFVHGELADNYIKKYSKSSLTASKIIDELKSYEI